MKEAFFIVKYVRFNYIMKKNKLIINWFRQDLRLHDNPSLCLATQDGIVIPVFIFDTYNKHQIGGASKLWLHHSLVSLQKSLKGNLYIFFGNPREILLNLSQKYQVHSIYWNRCYEPWQIERDKLIKKDLEDRNIMTRSFNSSLLWEPWSILKKDNTPYKVFTPFYQRGCLMYGDTPRTPLPNPNICNNIRFVEENSDISILNLLPKHQWCKKIENHWNIGEEAANNKLDQFILKGLNNYKYYRDYPSEDCTSLLSPHLHWGEISPFYVWQKISNLQSNEHIAHFLSELGWREFSYYLIYHFPFIITQNLQEKFNSFPWLDDKKYLLAWKKGLTGYPIVDAGMRQLWQKGYIHNRIRMVVGSFLVKNLLIHWSYGAKWFGDCLVDADLASNSASWQWVAGCGADAAPYFRIYNPVKQGIKFDAQGLYTRKYIPELKDLPNKYLFAPWEAPKNILKDAGIELGHNYPLPIVDLQESRNKALEAYKNIKFILGSN